MGYQSLCKFLERGPILVGPPVIQIAITIEFASLIVKGMTDFMPNDSSDRAIIDCRVGRWIEDRRLQNRCGKYDFVQARVVIGIDRLRCHSPLFSINRLAKFRQHPLVLVASGSLHISSQIIAGDLQVAVVSPLFGVANFRGDLGQLFLRAQFGGGSHPGQFIHAVAEGGQQILHQQVHLFFGLGRKMLFDIQFPDRIPQHAKVTSAGTRGRLNRPLPARFLLRNTG